MEGIFEVTLAGQNVGTVELKREGLYCRILCRCRVADGEIHRLYAGGERIGVLIPENGSLTLETKVPAKRLTPGCAFTLDGNTDKFIPIRPGEAFAHLDKVRQGKLIIRDNQPGLMI